VSRDDLLSAVLEPRRRAILRHLADGELPVGRLASHFDVSRPAISQHLAVLRTAGLVDMRADRGRNVYSIVPERVTEARRALGALARELPGAEEQAPEGASAEGVASAAERVASAAQYAVSAPVAGPPDLALDQHATAPPERVFALASTAAGQRLWLGEAENDAEPAGPFRVSLGGDMAAGTYRAVEAPSHIAFGWGQEGGGPLPADSSRVDIHLTPTPTGTLIRLEHRGLPPSLHAAHLASWAYHLPRLAHAAEAA
jgi:DNA-binding transcriptional ArsR family regulator/uncharacterized protein YndB with AHSA1/START domain